MFTLRTGGNQPGSCYGNNCTCTAATELNRDSLTSLQRFAEFLQIKKAKNDTAHAQYLKDQRKKLQELCKPLYLCNISLGGGGGGHILVSPFLS